MEKEKIVADLNGKKTAITKQCDDKEVRPITRNIYLPLYGTPTIGNYVPPKPLEERMPYEEANAPNVINYQVACKDCELGKSGTCPHRR